jgi:hypothetical protein
MKNNMTNLEYDQKLAFYMKKYARKDKERSGLSESDIPEPKHHGIEILTDLGYALEQSSHSIMIYWNKPEEKEKQTEFGK